MVILRDLPSSNLVDFLRVFALRAPSANTSNASVSSALALGVPRGQGRPGKHHQSEGPEDRFVFHPVEEREVVLVTG